MHIFAEVELLLPRFELRWQSTGGVAIWNNNLASQDGVQDGEPRECSRWRTKMANQMSVQEGVPRWRTKRAFKMANQDGEPNERPRWRPKMANQESVQDGEPNECPRWRTKMTNQMSVQDGVPRARLPQESDAATESVVTPQRSATMMRLNLVLSWNWCSIFSVWRDLTVSSEKWMRLLIFRFY